MEAQPIMSRGMNTQQLVRIPVQGIAVKAGISKNNIKYTPEALSKTSHELADKPILKDHKAITDNTIGRTITSEYKDGTIYYEGWIREDGTGIIQRIMDGRIKEVSIGAMVDRLVKESDDDDEALIAEGIHYLELSTTPTPGVTGTSITAPATNSAKTSTKDFDIKVPLFESIKTILPIEEKENTETAEEIPTKKAVHLPEFPKEDTINQKIFKQDNLTIIKETGGGLNMKEEIAINEGNISLEKYKQMRNELYRLKDQIKEDMVKEILALNENLKKDDLMEKEMSELRLIRTYEDKLNIAKKEVETVKPKAEVKEAKEDLMEAFHVIPKTEGRIQAKSGQVVIERTGAGKINFFKMPDYSKWRR